MRYIDSKSIGAISSVLTVGGGLSLAAGSGVFSMLFGAGKGKGLSKTQQKKLSRRRRRRFVDNIVMHHKRLHDRNREVSINLVKSRLMDKKNAKIKPKLSKNKTHIKWQDRLEVKEKTQSMRERVNARRVRANSRWLSSISMSNKCESNFTPPPDFNESSLPLSDQF